MHTDIRSGELMATTARWRHARTNSPSGRCTPSASRGSSMSNYGRHSGCQSDLDLLTPANQAALPRTHTVHDTSWAAVAATPLRRRRSPLAVRWAWNKMGDRVQFREPIQQVPIEPSGGAGVTERAEKTSAIADAVGWKHGTGGTISRGDGLHPIFFRKTMMYKHTPQLIHV